MRNLSKFESFQEPTDDIKTVYDIFRDDDFENIYSLKKEISKISDRKITIGLLVELTRPDMDYNINRKDVEELLIDTIEDDDKLTDIHDYYINKLREDVRSIMYDFLHNIEGDVTENQEFIDWLKSLSSNDIKILEEHCIEVELYEIITFMRSL
jgi:hypothetical protein